MTDSGSVKLELRNLRKVFGTDIAVQDSNLAVMEGEFLSLLGPSGCGKSTTLAMIAGFEEPTGGEILVDGNSVAGLAPRKRRIGLVFQDYAVFTKLSVRKNLAFGLEAQGVAARARRELVAEFAEKLNLEALLDVRGGDLNMSEMQRVALARVLVTRPQLLLLDEPMSNLDASLRARLRTELKRIQKDLGQTVLYVTHDQVEAMSMSDRIAVMDGGEIVQVGTPDTIYRQPRTRFVAEFIGDPPINLLPCTVTADSSGTLMAMSARSGQLPGPVDAAPGEYLLGVRPQHVSVSTESRNGSTPGEVRLVENFGAEHVAHVSFGEGLITAMVPPGTARVDEIVHVSLDLRHALFIDPDSGAVVSARAQTEAA